MDFFDAFEADFTDFLEALDALFTAFVEALLADFTEAFDDAFVFTFVLLMLGSGCRSDFGV
jgi:hypothetical protein